MIWENALQGHGEIEVIIAHERVFAITWTHLHAFHYPSGRPLGEVALPGRYKGRPGVVLERGFLYVSGSGEVTASTSTDG